MVSTKIHILQFSVLLMVKIGLTVWTQSKPKGGQMDFFSFKKIAYRAGGQNHDLLKNVPARCTMYQRNSNQAGFHTEYGMQGMNQEK